MAPSGIAKPFAPALFGGRTASQVNLGAGSNVAALSSSGAFVAFSTHASRNVAPSRPGRVFVRTEIGLATSNLKCCGCRRRSTGTPAGTSSVYSTVHASVCAPSSFRSCSTMKSYDDPG